MAKTFRKWDVDQMMLLPPSVQDFVGEDHPAPFIRDLVRESLDLSAILDCYQEERGYPPYDPVMMTALLLYAYSRGIYSSRRMAKACEERVDFMAITAMQRPDFRTISEFRRRHLEALGELFGQVLRLCQKAGLVKLGHVALDGTKIQANASKHKAMSYGRMKKAIPELEEVVEGWLERAEAEDRREDERYGEDRRGDEMPEWVKEKAKRLEKIREAKAALEEEARREAEERGKEGGDESRRRGGRPRKHPLGTPKDSAQRNFTDPESRVMKGKEGFIQGYNAQAAVDAESQVIVAQGLTDSARDVNQLVPLVEGIEAGTGRLPKEVSADSDYCSEGNLEELERRGVRGYIATGKQQHGKSSPVVPRETPPGSLVRRMQERLRRGGYRSRYRLRKQTAEPVFGQIKQARGFRQFLLRGAQKARREWALICTAHNLLKLVAVRA